MILQAESAESADPGRQAGFTLVETLVAVVVLVFGLMAVTNLLLVAASSNSVSNVSGAATASAAHMMDALRSADWFNLAAGGNLAADTTNPSPACNGTAVTIRSYNCDDVMPGVGTIKTRWQIAPLPGPPATGRLIQIQVRSEGMGVLTGQRTRASFTIFRACTDTTRGGCPAN